MSYTINLDFRNGKNKLIFLDMRTFCIDTFLSLPVISSYPTKYITIFSFVCLITDFKCHNPWEGRLFFIRNTAIVISLYIHFTQSNDAHIQYYNKRSRVSFHLQLSWSGPERTQHPWSCNEDMGGRLCVAVWGPVGTMYSVYYVSKTLFLILKTHVKTI